MFDPKKRVLMNANATVEEWIEELRKLPNIPVSICGACNGYVHVNVDEEGNPKGITIDCDSLDECYPDPDEDDVEEMENTEEEKELRLAYDTAYEAYPRKKLLAMSDDELTQAILSSKMLGGRVAAIMQTRITKIREKRAHKDGYTTDNLVEELKEYPGIPVTGDYFVVYDDTGDNIDHIRLGSEK